MIHLILSNPLKSSCVPSTQNAQNALILMPLASQFFDGLPWNLNKSGAHCHVDRNLITGASPEASNAFGKLAAQELLDSLVSG